MTSTTAIRPSHARINDASEVGLLCQHESKQACEQASKQACEQASKQVCEQASKRSINDSNIRIAY